jgi:hypothetical protein
MIPEERMSKGGRSRSTRRPTSGASSRTTAARATATHPAPVKPANPPTAVKNSAKAPVAAAITAPEVAAPAQPTAARVVGAITRGLPYALLEYVAFLTVVETFPALTRLIGVIFVLIAVVAFLIIEGVIKTPGDLATWKRMIAAWVGEPRAIYASFLLLAAALFSWAAWRERGWGAFSPLAVIFLLGALASVLYAQYRSAE